MSVISKIFGPPKKGESVQSPSQAVQRLRDMEEMLQKKSDFLEQKIEHEMSVAKKNSSKNKQAALQALRRKQRYMKQLQQVDGTLSTVEFQRAALENATTNTEVFRVMGDAAKALKNAHQNMNVEDVHTLMDDIAEQHEIADELSDALSSAVGFSQDISDDEILAELEELMKDETEDDVTVNRLPSVPSQEPEHTRLAKGKQRVEEDEMKALEAWAS